MATQVRDYFRRFPLRRRKTASGSATMSASAPTGKARGYAIYGSGNNPTVESRLDAIEKNVLRIHERIDETQRDLDVEIRKLTESNRRESEARLSSEAALRSKIENLGVGGLHISVIGTVWLLIGLALTTITQEIVAGVAWIKLVI